MRGIKLTLCLGTFGMTLAPQSLAAITDPVRVEQGQLAGAEGRGPDVRVYRGVPFAAPPVGDLRWKPPQPAASWQGIRQATQLGNACSQPPFPSNGLYGTSPPTASEDCLYLSIWTPAKSADDLPVQARYPLEGGVELRSVALPQPKKNHVIEVYETGDS